MNRDDFFANRGLPTTDLSVRIGPLQLRNPVMPASGCFGPELAELCSVSELGALVTKTVFATARGGNIEHRLTDFGTAMLNSVGIPSEGPQAFIAKLLPQYRSLDTPTIVSVGGLLEAEYPLIIDAFADEAIDAFELNVSCPNLEHGGIEIGADPKVVERVTCAARARTDAALLVKLPPMVTSIADTALAAEAGGADAVTVANSFPALAFEPRGKPSDRFRPAVGNSQGGLTGPAIKTLALRLVWQATSAVSIPVIGCGGIATAEDAGEYFACGAQAIQVGTANFARPFVMAEIARDLDLLCQNAGASSLSEFTSLMGISNGNSKSRQISAFQEQI